MLTANNITFGYTSEPLLNDVSMMLTPRQVLGILGPNGAGKSTLLKILNGYLSPWEGTVVLGDTEIADMSPLEIGQQVAVVPQQPDFRFGYTVRELVGMGRRPYHGLFDGFSDRDSEVVEAALRNTGLSDLAERPVTTLSGGEAQLTLVARALAQETPVILLDEATSSLDLKHTIDILGTVRERALTDNIAVGAVIHDINTAVAFCDSVIMLHNGGVVGPAPPAELVTEANLETVYGVDPSHLHIQTEPLHVAYNLKGRTGK